MLLRTGSYACAGWEFGGFPYWLLNEKTDGKLPVVRSTAPNFLHYSGLFLDRVGKECASLQAGRAGGNILMVQVENEYGSFGTDPAYMAAIRDQIRHAGFSSRCVPPMEPARCRMAISRARSRPRWRRKRHAGGDR